MKEVAELANRTQDAYARVRPLGNAVLLATLDGRLEEAVSRAEELVTRAEELGSPLTGLQYWANLGMRARLYLGHFQEALAALDEFQRLSFREILTDRANRALCLALLGKDGEAKSLLDESLIAWRRDGPDREALAGGIALLLEVAVHLKDREAATLLLPSLVPLSGILVTRSQDLSCPARLLGAAARLLGDPRPAEAYYGQALEVCDKVGFRPEIALIRLSLAELLLEHYPDRKEAADEHLSFAVEELREMGMKPGLDKAIRLQVRTSESS